MKSIEKMAILPKLTIQRRSFFSTGCSLLKYRKRICLKQLFFLFIFLISFNSSSQTLGLERFKRSEGNTKYMVFDNLQDALDIYNELVEANGFFYKDMYHELYKDEEVLLSFTIINDNDAAVLFVANRPTGGYVLEVYIIPNNKRIMVRDSKKTNGEVFTYYFDPEKEEEKEE